MAAFEARLTWVIPGNISANTKNLAFNDSLLALSTALWVAFFSAVDEASLFFPFLEVPVEAAFPALLSTRESSISSNDRSSSPCPAPCAPARSSNPVMEEKRSSCESEERLEIVLWWSIDGS